VRHWKRQQVEAVLRHLCTYAPCSGEALQQALGLQDSRTPDEVQRLAELLQRVLEVLAEVAEQGGPRGPRPGGAPAGAKAAAAEDADEAALAPTEAAAAAPAAGGEKAEGGDKEGGGVSDPAELARLVSERVAVPEGAARALLGPSLLRGLGRQARSHLEALREQAAVAAKRREDGGFTAPPVPTRGAGLPKWCVRRGVRASSAAPAAA
jgi:hypothetical protein